MRLVDDPDTVAKKHSKVSAKRRKELVGFLQNTDPSTYPQTLATLRENQIPQEELDLVEELLAVKPATVKSTKDNA